LVARTVRDREVESSNLSTPTEEYNYIMDRKIELNLRTVLIVLGIGVVGFLLWRIRGVLFIIVVSYLISAAILPFAEWFQKKGINRPLSIFLAYLAVIIVLLGVGVIIIPPLVAETSKFYINFPQYFAKFSSDLQIDTSLLNQNLEQFGASVVKVVLAILSNTVEFVTIFVISIYISFERKHFDRYFIDIFGENLGKTIHRVMGKVENRLGRWIRGQIFLDLTIGILTYVCLLVLGFPYAIPLAVMAGVLEAVPNIGPIISAIPAVIIGFTISPVMGVAALIAYIIIQQVENHLIVPRVMAQVAGLRPLAVIIVLLIGGSLMGTMGVILAIPVFLIIHTVLTELGRE
jgi:predicted PurR-regulated permease PerM